MTLAHLHPRRLLLAMVCLGVSIAASAARAETLNVPADGSGISLDLPAGWTSDTKGDTLICTSPGGVFRVEFSPAPGTTNPTELLRKEAHKIADAEKFSVTLEKEEGADINDHGVKTQSCRLEGTTPGGENRTVGTALLTPPGGTACLVRAVIKSDDKGKYMPDMRAMFQSFRPAGGKTTAVPAAGAGGPVKFPADGSSITFTLPPGWTATPEGEGLRLAANDGTMSVIFLPADDFTDPARQLPPTARTLADNNGVTDTEAEEQERKSRADESVTIHFSSLQGKRGGHAMIVGIAMISPARGKPCLLELVIDTVVAKAHQQELERFLDTIKSAR